MTESSDDRPIACSACFSDVGLRLDAGSLGREVQGACPNCGRADGRKLPTRALETLAYRFFVWGTIQRLEYGAAPLIQFNRSQKTSIDVPLPLLRDVHLLEKLLGIGFFDYGPRLWMIGEVEPLKDLQDPEKRSSIISRVINEYPEYVLNKEEIFYRVRKSPASPNIISEYDSPPNSFLGNGRLESPDLPILYTSPDLELCVHECRYTAEDDLFVATMSPTSQIRMLDLSVILEETATEFESLDMAIHMLFLAGKHSYPITRDIARAVSAAGYAGIIYPSFFTLLRAGLVPFPTVYGISFRRFPQLRRHPQNHTAQNIAIFGRPVTQGLVAVECINRLMMSRVRYDFHFGPAI